MEATDRERLRRLLNDEIAQDVRQDLRTHHRLRQTRILALPQRRALPVSVVTNSVTHSTCITTKIIISKIYSFKSEIFFNTKI